MRLNKYIVAFYDVLRYLAKM